MEQKLTYVFAYNDNGEDDELSKMGNDLILDIFKTEEDYNNEAFYLPGGIRVTYMGPEAAHMQGLDVWEAKDNTRAWFEDKYKVEIVYPHD